MRALGALIQRDIRIALRVGGGALIGVLFFLTVVVLMPFAVGPDLKLLARLGPAILWLGALLSSLLTLSIPVLIFGVAASEAAITGPHSFGAPFAILCALSLVSLVVGPFAAAVSLRHGLD